MKDKIVRFFSGDRPAAERLGSEPVDRLLLSMAVPSVVAMLRREYNRNRDRNDSRGR